MPLLRIIFGSIALACAAPTGISPAAAQNASAARDGQKDFDFEFGTWITSVRVLRNPLSGQAPDWADYRGTSVVHPLLDGRANFVELSVAGAKGKIEGGSLRLYNPQTRQWSLNFASLRNGMLTAPVYGGFGEPKRGVFYGQDMIDGRAVMVRFIVTLVSPREAHFDQAFSADGGVTWETNWVAVDTLRTRSTG